MAKIKKLIKQIKVTKGEGPKIEITSIDYTRYNIPYIIYKIGDKAMIQARRRGLGSWERLDKGPNNPSILPEGIAEQLEDYYQQQINTVLGKITQKLASLESKLGEVDATKSLAEQARKDAEAIRDAANIVEKSRINFTQIYQDVKTAGLEATVDIENIAEQADERIEISTLYVEAYNSIKMKDYKSAFNIYKQVLKIDNNQPRALGGIAYIFEQQGLTEKADKYRKLAAEIEAQRIE